MKFCLTNRLPEDVLKKADEIKISLRDHLAIPEYIVKYPDKTLILDMSNDIPDNFNWDILPSYKAQMKGRFYCAASNYGQMKELKQLGINFYYKYAVTSFYEIEALKEIGVAYLLVGVPLIFNLKNVKKFGIPLRAIPHMAYEPYLSHKNGIIGGWIRPEDVDKYGEYIDVMEFYAPKAANKESQLFKVYAEQKTWPGNLNLLIDDLNKDFDNRILFDKENFAERRMNCKQKCLEGKPCHYCEDQLEFEKTLKLYREYKKDN